MNSTHAQFRNWILVVLLCLTGCTPVLAQGGPPKYRADRILVKPKPGVSLADLHTRLGARVRHTFPGLKNLQVIQLPPQANPVAVAALYQQSGLVEYAEPDFVVHATVAPNDPYFQDGTQWNLQNVGQSGGRADADIDAPEAWDTRTSANDVIVAIIDTGARYTHEDLAGNIWVNPGESGLDAQGRDKATNQIDDDGDGYVDDAHGINAILGTGDPWDDHGHGTHVSGIVGGEGNNGVGVAGVAWQARLMPLKFLNNQAEGFISDAIECIDYARLKGAKVINASWGGYDFTSNALRDAITKARDAGILFVAATGNDGSDNDGKPLYPASYDLDNIIAVAATTRRDELASFSNFGATTVDLGAPGANIWSTWNSGDSAYEYMSGTSMAAPHVTGACALVWAQYPGDDYLHIKNRILAETDPLPVLSGKCVTGGRLNVWKALGATANSEVPVITLSGIDPYASEVGPDPGAIRFHRTGDPSQPINQLNWTFSGTAINGTDYEQLPTSSPYPAGLSDADLTITPIADSQVESNETVVVTLIDGPGYTVGTPNTATVTIADSSQPGGELPVLSISAIEPNGSETGPNPGVIRFYRTGDLSQPINQVNWTFSGTADNGTDFEKLPTTSPFPAGLSDADLTITPIDDSVLEGDETVTVTLASGSEYTIGSPATATVTIADNDSTQPLLPTVTVAADDPAAAEPKDPGSFTVSRTGSTANPLKVHYSLGGTASKGKDYHKLPDSTTIPKGSASVNIVVQPVDDKTAEGDETVVLTLVDNQDYSIGTPASATVTIADNDAKSAPIMGSPANPIVVLGDGGPALHSPIIGGGLSAGPNLSAPSASSGTSGEFEVSLTGKPQKSYVLETSTNLTDWKVVTTNQANAIGRIIFRDEQPQGTGQKFYRGRATGPGALGQRYRTDRVLVKPRLDVTLAELSALNVSLGVTTLHGFPSLGNLQIVRTPDNLTAATLVELYKQSGLVQYAENDFYVRALAEPNDPRFQDGSLWNLHNTGQDGGAADADIDAPEAWDITNDAGSVIVAVIDSGVRATHEDLVPNLWINTGETAGNGIDDDGDGFVDDVNGINAITGTGNPDDDYGHGSHVAGIIGAAGNNAAGIVGICWHVQLMACKFLDAKGDGSISDAITCIAYARDHGAQVINASWGNNTTFNSQALRDAIASARDAGIIVSAACGNSAGNNDTVTDAIYPASYDLDNIIAVAASTRSDGLATFSNYGPTNVDLAAPGTPIWSCWNGSDSDYQIDDGTSMAAAHVSGAAALLRAYYPNDTYRQTIQRILGSVDPLPALAGKCATGGRLNLQKALGVNPSGTPVITLSSFDPNASETGPDSGSIRFHRTGDPSQAIPEVNWSFSGTAVNGTDYEQLPTTSEFPAGLSDADLTIDPIADSETEGEETVIVTLQDGPGYTVGSPNSATVTITDDGQPGGGLPVLTISAIDPDGSETDSEQGVIRFHRTGDNSQALQVNWTFSGTAENGSDFDQLPTTSPFPAGLSDADLTITPIDDTAVEGNETVVVTLVEGSGYTIGADNTATVTIADNDSGPPPLPTVTVAASDPNASESDDTGTYTISRTGDTTSSLTVSYLMSGTAANGTDYDNLPGSITIPAGAASADVTLTPVDDSEVEDDETAVLTLAGDSTYTVGSTDNATITIADNDQAPALVADFSASPLLGLVPLVVNFTDQSSGNPILWEWDFGDGSTSTAQNPTHIYLLPGDYVATLTVHDDAGAASSKSATIQATVLPQSAANDTAK